MGSPSCENTMSGWAGARIVVAGAIRQSTRPAVSVPAPFRFSSRSFSLRRQHDAGIRAQKEAIRQRIRALEQSRRRFAVSSVQKHGHIDPPKPGEELHVTFIDKDGDRHEFEVAEGDNLLDIAQANDLEMEGACGGSCACSTCHVIVQDEDVYDKIPEADDDENDMLDLAFGLTETSRLGCQIKMNKDIDGIVVKLPSMTRNMQAADFQSK